VSGLRPGRTSEETEELKRLRRENTELRRANDILKAAASFFETEPARTIHTVILNQLPALRHGQHVQYRHDDSTRNPG
jgi:hypothetical protein